MRLVILVKSKYLAKWIDKNGVTRYRYKPLVGPRLSYGTVPDEVFVKSRDSMLSKKYAGFVTKYTPEEYVAKGARMFVSPDGNSGYAITKTGDLISVFSKPGSGAGMEVMKTAIKNGAKTLDCIGPYLPQFYAKFGFKESGRMKWDDQYAPPNWDYAKLGRPDIVEMKLDKQVMKSKDIEKIQKDTTPDFKALSLGYMREFFGNKFVDYVLKGDSNG